MDWLQYGVFAMGMNTISVTHTAYIDIFSPPLKETTVLVHSYSHPLDTELQLLCNNKGSHTWIPVIAALTATMARYNDQQQVALGLLIDSHSELICLPIASTIDALTSGADILSYTESAILSGLSTSKRILSDNKSLFLGPKGSLRVAFAALRANEDDIGCNSNISVSQLIESRTFDVVFILDQTNEQWMLHCHCTTECIDTYVARFLEHTLRILQSILQCPNTYICLIDFLSSAEKNQQLEEWNNTQRSWNACCIHYLITEQANKNPDKSAIIWQDQTLTYKQLESQANQLAQILQEYNIGPNSLVAVYMDRTPALLITLLAIMKTGGAYLPLDIKHPSQRLNQILSDASPSLIVSQEHLVGYLNTFSGMKIIYNQEKINTYPTDLSAPYMAPDHPIYVIYTSGSTGKPKGISVSHRSVSAFLEWISTTYSSEELQLVLASTSISFDISVFETWGVLYMGGTLLLVDHVLDMPMWASLEVTLINTVPSALAEILYIDGLPESVCCVNLAGEASSQTLVSELWQHAHIKRILNVYGPTETTIYSTWADLPQDIKDTPPIGRPLPNEHCYILDNQLQLLAVGVKGTLYIGGVGVASGYLNQPALTAQKFVPNPFLANDRLYNTGDIVCFRENGTIEYHGRSDQQLKIRGYRVELGEIETTLNQCEGVTASVVVENVNEHGKHLIAYIVPDHQLHIAAAESQLLELPNGLKIVPQNMNEALHLYDVIFTEEEYLLHGIQLRDNACVFDIGANIGLFALYVNQKCLNPTVYAFEPVPAIYHTAQMNMDLYGLNVHMFMYGLADSERVIDFTYYPKWSALSGAYGNRDEEEQLSKSFLENDPFFAQYSTELVEGRFEGERVTCQLRTLSQVIREQNIEHIDLIKINVEKSELDVLLGIEDNDWPKIRQVVVEVHNSGDSLKRVHILLEKHGFQVRTVQNSIFKNTVLFTVYAQRSQQSQLNATPTILHQSKTGVPVRAIHDQLKQKLPDYMIPRGYIILDQLPFTYNAKIDRRNLPSIANSRLIIMHDEIYVAPEDDLQQLLVGIWQQVLGLERIGIHDNFFDLGGTSIAAARVHNQLQVLKLRSIKLSEMFQYPTIEKLALYLSEDQIHLPVQHRATARRKAIERRQQIRKQNS